MTARLRQVLIKNFKSIHQAVVDLGSFTALVGPNGAGKSNFVDAFAFVADALSGSLELAFKNRGGISAVRRRSHGHPTHVGLRFILDLDTGPADYSFEIAAKPTERLHIARERCLVGQRGDGFEVKDGRFLREIPGIRPQVAPDRLALFAASATEEFRPVYDFLSSMQVYSIEPGRLRELQDPDVGEVLKPDGSNAAAVMKRLAEQQPERFDRVCRLLAKVVRGVEKVDYKSVGSKETLTFRQDVGQRNLWFDALNMSDGTLRVLGLLLAAYQPHPSSLVAIEEPEATVHPAAAELLVQVLLDAARERQIVITTHSPDILDFKDLSDDQIRVVTVDRGSTLVAPLSAVSRRAIREHLYSPGELLRSGELGEDRAAAEEKARQLRLFGPPVRVEPAAAT